MMAVVESQCVVDETGERNLVELMDVKSLPAACVVTFVVASRKVGLALAGQEQKTWLCSYTWRRKTFALNCISNPHASHQTMDAMIERQPIDCGITSYPGFNICGIEHTRPRQLPSS
jgi:hypothetical protein